MKKQPHHHCQNYVRIAKNKNNNNKNSSLKELYRITPHAPSHAGTETQPLPGATETTLTESLSRPAVNEPWPGTFSDVQESQSIHAAVSPLTLADTVTDRLAVHPALL